MATYKDDLDIIKDAEKDNKNMTLNAITELDNRGLLGKYGGEGGEFDVVSVDVDNSTSGTVTVGFCAITRESTSEILVIPTSLSIPQNAVFDLDIVENSRVLISDDGVVVDHTEGQVVKVDDNMCDVYGPGTIVLTAGSTPK